MAYKLLVQYGHEAIGINPHETERGVYQTLKQALVNEGRPHTLTLYVRPQVSDTLIDLILEVNPQRVIFNPGTENINLMHTLDEAGIKWTRGCTLVMLRTHQF